MAIGDTLTRQRTASPTSTASSPGTRTSGYNLTGRGGPVTNLTVIYDELAR